MMSLMESHKLLSTVNSFVISLPTPRNISYWWNFGSMLGVCLGIQIVTGVFLALHYCNDSTMAFQSVVHIMRDVNSGWVMRLVHMNGASFFFICLYLHIGRNLYYESYNNKLTWASGMTIFLLTMLTAFMGYVLPWGQMSFWGVTVITNLFSAFPGGDSITMWIWGGFSVDAPTLSRFFSFHFLVPFLILALVMFHLIFLHEKGSSNPLGVSGDFQKIVFHPFFTLKDLLGFLYMFLLFSGVVFFAPWFFSDPENFIPANSMNTPHKIVPEWYFLFAYAILRSIPSKVGGVVAMLASIVVFYLLPLSSPDRVKGKTFNPLGKLYFFLFLGSFVTLTWVGGQPAEGAYIILGQIGTAFYFFYLSSFLGVNSLWGHLLQKCPGK